MRLQFFLTIFLSLWTLIVSQDFKGSSSLKSYNRYSSLRHSRPKSALIKRVPGISPLIPSKGSSRILNKTPFNLLQNGPYHINHYIYCDNIDQHTMEQIKAGTISSDKEIQLLNLHNDEFHNVAGGFTGNKEFHVLHLPKDKNYNHDDVKLHLSLLNAHKSPEVPDIDLELNQHVGNFEVNLGDIKPLDLDTSYPYPIKSSTNDIVSPLFQGHVSSGQNHKDHNNLMQLADYLNENSHGQKEHLLEHFSNFDNSHETNPHGGILDLPHFERHPLERDSGKASYDTPGALDSYGHPATESSLPNAHLNFNVGSFSNGFGNGFKGNDLYQSEEYINQLNEINGLQRKRRMDAYASTTTENSKSQEIQHQEDVRHSNHKYN